MEMLDMRRSIRQFWPYYLGIGLLSFLSASFCWLGAYTAGIRSIDRTQRIEPENLGVVLAVSLILLSAVLRALTSKRAAKGYVKDSTPRWVMAIGFGVVILSVATGLFLLGRHQAFPPSAREAARRANMELRNWKAIRLETAGLITTADNNLSTIRSINSRLQKWEVQLAKTKTALNDCQNEVLPSDLRSIYDFVSGVLDIDSQLVALYKSLITEIEYMRSLPLAEQDKLDDQKIDLLIRRIEELEQSQQTVWASRPAQVP